MIDPNLFIEFLIKKEINFYSGIPDSLLKELCFCIDEKIDPKNHKITANEVQLLSCRILLVYWKNSTCIFSKLRLGNAINPLLSLCDTSVYKIPMIILIGWRETWDFRRTSTHKTRCNSRDF